MTDPRALPNPESAFQFLASGLSVADGEQGRRFEGVAYSGEPIRNHWHWGTVVFDLSSTRAAERIPALVDHDRGQRAGWAALQIGPENITATGEFLTNDHGAAVAADSLAGFPWQMSVHIEPARIEELQPGTRTTVNGRELVGPAVIFRDSRIREVSFTATGADPNTSARAFTRGAVAANPEAFAMSETEHAARIAALEAQLASVTAERDTAREQIAAQFAAQRRSEVERLFADLGRQFTDAAAAPYLALPAEQFAAVSADLRATRGPDRADLTSETATRGSEPKLSNDEIVKRARQYHAEQTKAGNPVTFAAAVRAVTPKE